MKIISKFRDYYDRHVGDFGFDTDRVYDRRAESFPEGEKSKKPYILTEQSGNSEYAIFATFYICGETYKIAKWRGKFYNDFKELKDAGAKISFYKSICKLGLVEFNNKNKEYRQPVIMEDEYGNLYIPRLADYDFPKFINSREIYIKIYDFLGWLKDNPPIPNKQNDKEKILSHGFCKKTSFRPKIKS